MKRGPGIRSRNTAAVRRGRPLQWPDGLSRSRRRPEAAVALAATALILMVLCASPVVAVPLPDFNEPNDSFVQATALVNGESQWGALTAETDMDYFYLDLPGSGQVTVHFDPNAVGRNATIASGPKAPRTCLILTGRKITIATAATPSHGTLGPGRVFVIVSLVGGAAPSTMVYNLTVSYTGGSSGDFPDVTGPPLLCPHHVPRRQRGRHRLRRRQLRPGRPRHPAAVRQDDRAGSQLPRVLREQLQVLGRRQEHHRQLHGSQ